VTIRFLLDRFSEHSEQDAIVWRDCVITYAGLIQAVEQARAELRAAGLDAGTVVALKADFSPRSIALLLALIDAGCIVVPLLSSALDDSVAEKCRIAGVDALITVDPLDTVRIDQLQVSRPPRLLDDLRASGKPGLVLFTSGTTGEPKGAVHDCSRLLEKFRTPRPQQRILNFLLFDHIGGFNTLFHTLSNTGVVLTVQDRSPETICAAIEKYRIEVLPVSPTFLNLLLLSEAYNRFDLSSLKVVTYGSESMPQSVLDRVSDVFKGVRVQQTYGLIEIGILRSKSLGNDSLWVKIGGEGFEWRVVDGKLEIKADSAMLGYLNAPSPFTDDGWFMTGDEVQVDGDYVRILGRASEQINIGGEKVFPSEVEGVILELDEVADVLVHGESNAITGKMVAADIVPRDVGIDGDRKRELIRRVKGHCQAKLEPFKIPVRIKLVADLPRSDRNKKLRRNDS